MEYQYVTEHTPTLDRGPESPWYNRVFRWGQTNITEKDPIRYDIAWWREYWKRTATQGIIVNAGGIVAYYPSRFPLHHQAKYLDGRDLFDELVQAAHEDGLAVLARLDSNRTAKDFYLAHPDWFACDASGNVIQAHENYITCVNSPYYDEFIPGILSEIIERSHPEGFTDNSWAGLSRDQICYCENCSRRFRDTTGNALPSAKDWSDSVYRDWIEWSYRRRIEIWDQNNRVTTGAGGADCLWIGMNSGSVTEQSHSFRNLSEICKRAKIILLDHQTRTDCAGFQQNGDTGKRVHGLLGWDKLMPESMAMYQGGKNWFRLTSKPAPEARLWMIEGFAGGIQPWWHHVGAYHEDRRMYRTAEPLTQWHRENQPYLIDRTPVAAVGVVWSRQNTDYYGQDNAAVIVDAPYLGFTQALIRARFPYVPVNVDCIETDGSGFSVLVLPSIGALSSDQLASIRRFVARGGALIATGPSSLFNEVGKEFDDFALGDLFGVHIASGSNECRCGTESCHSYLRLSPEMRGGVWGPEAGDEPEITESRHTVLDGFDETDIIAYGGVLYRLEVDPSAVVPLTFIPPCPVYPPETAWMQIPKTNIPALVLNTVGASRIAYLPADLDRRFGLDNSPDHGNLLANIVRWAADGRIPLEVHGAGLIDCHLYRQPNRMILHVVNLVSAGTWRSPVDELIPVGPFSVRVKLPDDVSGKAARSLVSGQSIEIEVNEGWAEFFIKSVKDHEVLIIE